MKEAIDMEAGFRFHRYLGQHHLLFHRPFPHGPLGGIALTLYLAVVACVLSFFGGLILGLLNISHNR